ncbi:MAG: rod shape-determining protein MreC [Chloroflexia bacterium]
MKSRDRSLESARTTSRTLTLLATCLLLALALLGLAGVPALQPVRGTLQAAVAPVQQMFSQATYGINSWLQTANNMHDLEATSAAQREQIAQLETEIARLKGLPAENSTLRQMLGFKQENPDLQSLPSLVVGRDPSGLSRILIIDRGSADGVRETMAVTSPGGYLLGVVSKVTPHQATVLLIDDVDSTVPSLIDRSHVEVNVQGQAQHGGRLLVTHIPQGADVAKGDLVKTSGLGGSLPRGLLLGQIYEVHQKDIAEEQEALAYPMAIPETIAQVLVILGAGPTGGAPRPVDAPPTVDPLASVTATPGLPAAIYPVPPTSTPPPTRTPMPKITPVPAAPPTSTPPKKR